MEPLAVLQGTRRCDLPHISFRDVAPECFYIEETLKKTMKIPVFHDDQHGTAIISGAALLNGLEVAGKVIGKIRLVINGAGAAAVATAEHYVRLGVKRENITLCDTKGVVYKGRTAGMNPYKERFAQNTTLRTLAEAMIDADMFLGLSVAATACARNRFSPGKKMFLRRLLRLQGFDVLSEVCHALLHFTLVAIAHMPE